MSRMQRLKNKLAQLASLDKEYEIFGSKRNPYQYNPCLTLLEVQAFEAKYNTTLPEDYRDFLVEIGNGGAAPGYGLFSLEKSLKEANFISKPFPYTEAGNNLDLADDNCDSNS